MAKLYRSAKVKIEVLSGRANLERAGWLAKKLWNNALWELFGYNRQLRRIRGDSWEQFKRNSPQARGEKYPGFVGLQNELRHNSEAVSLASLCFSYTIKELDEAIRSWFSSLKKNPDARPPRYAKGPRGLTFMVDAHGKRNAKPMGDWVFRLTVLGGHVPDRHAIVKLHLRPGVKMSQIRTIRYHPDGTGVINYQIEPQPEPGKRMAGLDLGIINLAGLAFDDGESILYSGKGLLSEVRLNEMRLSKCKPKDWRKGQARSYRSERAKEYAEKSGRVRQLAVHNVTTHIIQACVAKGVNTLVIGDLKGIRDGKDRGKAGNQKFHAWAFGEMRRQLEYKAQEYHIEVIPVSEAYTSQTCHLCGRVNKSNRKHRGLYRCDQCGAVMNADINGAFNILNKVSPAPARADVGVGGVFPTPPSTGTSQGTGQEPPKQIDPTYVARFDLRDFAVVQNRCARGKRVGCSD